MLLTIGRRVFIKEPRNCQKLSCLPLYCHGR